MTFNISQVDLEDIVMLFGTCTSTRKTAISHLPTTAMMGKKVYIYICIINDKHFVLELNKES